MTTENLSRLVPPLLEVVKMDPGEDFSSAVEGGDLGTLRSDVLPQSAALRDDAGSEGGGASCSRQFKKTSGTKNLVTLAKDVTEVLGH